MKTYALDTILRKSEEEIRELFPYGLMMYRKRWIAADHNSEGVGHRSLRQLIQAKRKKLMPALLLEQNPGFAKQDFTDRLDRAMRDEGESPPMAWMDANSDKCREDFDLTKKPLSQRVAELETNLGPAQLKSLEQRVTALERTRQDKAA